MRILGLVRWLVVLEVGIWRSLFLWVARRVPGRGPDVDEFGYAREVTPLLVVFTVLSALEIAVVDLLLPWHTVRIAAAVIGVWGLLWMLGYLAGMRVFKHLVGDAGLRVRNGPRVDIHVPWDDVAEVTARRSRVPTGATVHVEEGVASVAVMKQTRVAVRFGVPTTIALADGPRELVELRLYADDPRGFVAAAARHRRPDRHGAPR